MSCLFSAYEAPCCSALAHGSSACWRSHTSNPFPVKVGVHSAKATLLSWSRQLHLDRDLCRIQGHHKPSGADGSVSLYSRDGVASALLLQFEVMERIRSGFRPLQPTLEVLISPSRIFPSPCLHLPRLPCRTRWSRSPSPASAAHAAPASSSFYVEAFKLQFLLGLLIGQLRPPYRMTMMLTLLAQSLLAFLSTPICVSDATFCAIRVATWCICPVAASCPSRRW